MDQKIQLEKTIKDTLNWLNSIKNRANFRVKEVSLDINSSWSYENGAIRHTSHRFFNVIGVKYLDEDGKITYLPLIDQWEIGTLGFIWRDSNSIPEVLVQAKIEPGNVGIIQLAPSCQATASNADRVHGGSISPLSDVFGKDEVVVISDSLQSEQGTRFYHKLNRNVLAKLKNNNYKPEDVHKWLPVDVVLQMLKIDYLFNTDARSVLVCSDWEKLIGRKPFSSSNSKLSKELMDSYNHEGLYVKTDKLKTEINDSKSRIAPTEIVPLNELHGYRVDKSGVYPATKKPFSVKFIEVQTGYREVKSWNQPIIESAGEGKVRLTCARIDGILHFLFKPVIEPGLINKIELSPDTVIEHRGAVEDTHTVKDSKILIESWQSEEGGRFWFDKNLYQIADAGKTYLVPKAWVWLSLKQISELLKEGGWLTNETRSVLSLIMTWL
jgi:oxidase EvaA